MTEPNNTPTPPPTGNYFQYRADPNEKKLEFDAPPTEGYSREELKKHCWLDENNEEQMPLDEVEAILTQALAEQKARMVEEVYEKRKLEVSTNTDGLDTEDYELVTTERRYRNAYNDAIDEVLTIIKALSK